ncbi:MAG: acetate kinase [Deltaproteobacteria bacterium]|nr:MAG: acetate kinase [Deltaproteobacteria bacterium]
MYILVINAGSSSVKFTLFAGRELEARAWGQVERIGLSNTTIHYHRAHGENISKTVSIARTQEAVEVITGFLTDKEVGVIREKSEIAGIGHRVVHGGEQIHAPVRITDGVKKIIADCIPLAPLHNPVNLAGIEACEAVFTRIPQAAVFDTAFHAGLPEHAYLYGLPYRLYREDGIRRYGFHGTSHQYVSRKAARLMGRPAESLKMVTCHLGNGCSIAAVSRGKCVDTSMGFTPLEGVIMGTRCGDLDPAIVFYLMAEKKMTSRQVSDLLNKESGLLGLADVGSSDLRDIMAAADDGNKQARMAVLTFTYRIKKYIGAYLFAMGGIDAIVFTGGIGENIPGIREQVCRGLDRFGIGVDQKRNTAPGQWDREIQGDDHHVKVLVIPTNEEKEIGGQTIRELFEHE